MRYFCYFGPCYSGSGTQWKTGRTPKMEKMGKMWKIAPDPKWGKWPKNTEKKKQKENRASFPFCQFFGPFFPISDQGQFFSHFGLSARFPMESQTRVSKRAPREFRNWRVQGNPLTLRQRCANPLQTFSANPSPTPSFRGPQAPC